MPSKSASRRDPEHTGQRMMPNNQPGTILTCTNPECGCRLRIEAPCPHGDNYTCACGHPFVAAGNALTDVPA
jgi:hypothetical protein